MKVDLHLHTTASDGVLTPGQLVTEAARRGLSVIAITDHDSTEGIAEALETARDYPDLVVIPGVELSTDVPKGEVHVLGYYVDYQDKDFQARLDIMRSSRLDRARHMVEKLRRLGMPIRWDRVLELANGGSVGRPHVAEALLEAGHVGSFQEAFVKYIGRDGPAYAEREKLTPVEAVSLLAKVGSLPVLAHPGEMEGLYSYLSELTGAGLVGIEVYYSGYCPEICERLLKAARRYGLLVTGGSDYHGHGGKGEAELGSLSIPWESAQKLMEMAEQRRKAHVR
ncbi:MAG: PHP domain-containing protein [Chloroflexi bacterium]|nr:PHP domain-containing protein [Chloroflexota bacterium]